MKFPFSLFISPSSHKWGFYTKTKTAHIRCWTVYHQVWHHRLHEIITQQDSGGLWEQQGTLGNIYKSGDWELWVCAAPLTSVKVNDKHVCSTGRLHADLCNNHTRTYLVEAALQNPGTSGDSRPTQDKSNMKDFSGSLEYSVGRLTALVWRWLDVVIQ